MTRAVVTARAWDGGKERVIEVRGQTGRALVALVGAGARGCTALEVSDWVYRFAAHCYELRRRYRLDIRTEREDHAGGWHGRHILETPVDILSVEESPPCAAA